MIVRAAAIATVAPSALLIAVPALPWFSARTPAGDITVTGFGASGTLWVLPIVGLAAAAVAVALAIADPARFSPEAWWGGGALGALGALAAFWSLAVALDPPVAVVVADGAVDRAVPFAVERLPALFAAPAAGGLLVLAGVIIGWPKGGL